MRRLILLQRWNGQARRTTGMILLLAVVVLSLRLGTNSSAPSAHGLPTEGTSAPETRSLGGGCRSGARCAAADRQPTTERVLWRTACAHELVHRCLPERQLGWPRRRIPVWSG